MPARIALDGNLCEIEKLASGSIRIIALSPQVNPMHGPGTAGTVMYEIHPCQRHQYQYLDAHLPPQEQGLPEGSNADQKPWWSLSAGERAGLRE